MGIYGGYEVPRFYDPMLGKLIVHGMDRETARKRMLRALREMLVEGVRTNIPFHRWVLAREEFIEGNYDTRFIEQVCGHLAEGGRVYMVVSSLQDMDGLEDAMFRQGLAHRRMNSQRFDFEEISVLELRRPPGRTPEECVGGV